MSVKNRTQEAEPLNADELAFWRQCFRQAIPDCLSIKRSPVFCARVAGELADASVREYRDRVRLSRHS